MAQQQRVNPVSLLKEWARQKRPTQLLTSDFEQSNAASPPTDPDTPDSYKSGPLFRAVLRLGDDSWSGEWQPSKTAAQRNCAYKALKDLQNVRE